MEQQKKALYKVSNGETVTVEVTPTKTGNFVNFHINSANLEPASLDPLQFKFDASGAVSGSDYAVVSCHFGNDAPDDAAYELSLTGSQGGSFKGPKITKAGTIWDQDLTFVTV